MKLQDRQQYNILYSCTGEAKTGFEPFVTEHTLACILSGEFHVHTDQGIQIFRKGAICLIPRNQLIRGVKKPSSDGPFFAVNVFLTQKTLHEYSLTRDIHATGHFTGEPIVELVGDPFLKGYFDSLLPYFDRPEVLFAELAHIKTLEAIELILRNSRFKNLLFNFDEPFKINLDAYMNRHFMYNISMSQFAKLTGRSLATFKRDFKKLFHLPPEKWMLKKRLEQAHHLITQRKQRPSEVYFEVGFETLSHFSTAFKNEFGYSPSSLLANE